MADRRPRPAPLVACLLCAAAVLQVSRAPVTLASVARAPQLRRGDGDAAGEDSGQPEPPLSPAGLQRSPVVVRFSEMMSVQESESVTAAGAGGGAHRPLSGYDVGAALNPRDFSVGEEHQQTALSVPLVAGVTDPVELAGQFEGDIVLTAADRQAVDTGAVPGQRTWPGRALRYVIASGFSSTERGVIAAAVRELERRTCLAVHPVPPGAPTGDFVHIVRGTGAGCSSAVGRLGGNQTLTLSEGCFTRGLVLHELLHAAGLWHEQSRPDRYRHVRVLSEHVASGRLLDLRTYARVPAPLTPVYQRRSLMHLSRWAFSEDRRRVTLESTADRDEPLGQRDGLTPEDALAVNLLYECESGARPPLPTPPTASADCRDTNEHCEWWARRGECARNPDYMHEFCAKACHRCTGSSCDDLDRSCSMWAALDMCRSEASYMHVYCRRACDLCQPTPGAAAALSADQQCRDRSGHCSRWAGAGSCRQHVQYMVHHCASACGFCR